MNYNKKKRCQCINLTTNLVCKNKSTNINIFNKKRYCTFHYNFYKNYFVTIIQKLYKGYKTRRVYNNIFIKLPYDLQGKIVNYMREKYYYQKYLKTINNIVSKKISNQNLYFLDIINYTRLYLPNTIDKLEDYINNNYSNIENIYKLYTKYYYAIKNNYELRNLNNNFEYNLNLLVNNLEYSNYHDLYLILNSLVKKIFHYLHPDIYHI